MRCCLSYFSHPLHRVTLHLFSFTLFWGLFSAVPALCCCAGFSLVAAGRGCPSAAVHRTPAPGARTSAAAAPQLSSTGSAVVVRGFRFSVVLLDRRSNLCLLSCRLILYPLATREGPMHFLVRPLSSFSLSLPFSFSISLSLSYTQTHTHTFN